MNSEKNPTRATCLAIVILSFFGLLFANERVARNIQAKQVMQLQAEIATLKQSSISGQMSLRDGSQSVSLRGTSLR